MSIARGLLRAVLGSALSLVLFVSTTSAAEKYYMQVQGPKQGAFKGGVNRKGSRWIEVLSFSHAVKPPLDSATGKASGKRQHQPVAIRKSVDSASPALFQAAANSEVLQKVVFEIVRTGPAGKEQLYQTVTLTNARVSSAKKTGGKGTTNEQEEIEFTFAKIVMTDANGKVTATDDWTQTK